MILLIIGGASEEVATFLVTVATGALALTVVIFRAVYSCRPSQWLRILGLFHGAAIAAQFLVSILLFPNLVWLMVWYILTGFVIACVIGVLHYVFHCRLE